MASIAQIRYWSLIFFFFIVFLVILDEITGKQYSLFKNTNLITMFSDFLYLLGSFLIVVMNIIQDLLALKVPKLSEILSVLIKSLSWLGISVSGLVYDILALPWKFLSIIVTSIPNGKLIDIPNLISIYKNGDQLFGGVGVSSLPTLETLQARKETFTAWFIGIDFGDGKLSFGTFNKLYSEIGGDKVCAPILGCVEAPKTVINNEIYALLGINFISIGVEAKVLLGVTLNFTLSIIDSLVNYFSAISNSLGSWAEIFDKLLKRIL